MHPARKISPNPNPHYINQCPIYIPPPQINNNDGSKISQNLPTPEIHDNVVVMNKQKPTMTTTFMSGIDDKILYIGGAVISVIFLIYRKKL